MPEIDIGNVIQPSDDLLGPPMDWKEGIHHMYRDDVLSFAHAKPGRVGDTHSILANGFFAQTPDITTTTDHLFTPKQSEAAQMPRVMKYFEEGRHANGSHVIIFGLPLNPEGRTGKDYLNSFFDSMPEDQRIPGKMEYEVAIPPRYIMGYVDMNEGKFYPNTRFYPTPLNKEVHSWVAEKRDDSPEGDVRLPVAGDDNDAPPAKW